MHVTDILPTFAGLAGVPVPATATDGLPGFWLAISATAAGASPRREIAHMISNEWTVKNGNNPPCNSCNASRTLPGGRASNAKPGVNCAATDPFAANETEWGNSFRGCGGALLVGDLKLIMGYPGDTRLFGTYGSFDILFGPPLPPPSFHPRISQLHTTTHSPCDMTSSVYMLIGCWLVLTIRCCVQIGTPGLPEDAAGSGHEGQVPGFGVNGTVTSTSFWSISRVFVSPLPLHLRRVLCSTECPS